MRWFFSKRPPGGFTLVELLIGTGLFLVFLGVAFGTYTNYRTWFQASTTRLDVGHRLRLSGQRLDEMLTDCRKILYPPRGAASATRLLYLDSRNQLQAVSLDVTGLLTQIDVLQAIKGEPESARVLGGPLSLFQVEHVTLRQLSYRMTATPGKGKSETLQQLLQLWGAE
ncbi:MAG TPA: prepilin-type N-terminal cleavage/methylation domain-containing protein [Candidatus Ozemobacteraceae bacterium]|nr:prepilin-type N-terminal cleavage/methylation domain-containing protein [Candidatus Ozemobacteraceae bacterium]